MASWEGVVEQMVVCSGGLGEGPSGFNTSSPPGGLRRGGSGLGNVPELSGMTTRLPLHNSPLPRLTHGANHGALSWALTQGRQPMTGGS